MAVDPVEITATAQMMDDNLDSPFSRVDFYGRTGMSGATADLKFLGSVDTSAATTELVDTPCWAGLDLRARSQCRRL